MNEIMNINDEITMTSLEIANITYKNHKDVLKDIRDEINKLGNDRAERIFSLGEYTDKNNQQRPMYKLNSKGVLQLGARYSAEIRFKLISKIEELSKPKVLTQKELLIMQLEKEGLSLFLVLQLSVLRLLCIYYGSLRKKREFRIFLIL